MEMELHPYWEQNSIVQKNVWYILSATGDAPMLRVGHALVHIVPTSDGVSRGQLLVVGGANPSETFNDQLFVDLDKHHWDALNAEPSYRGCYEHTVLISADRTQLTLWGGADQTGNLDELQQYVDGHWKTLRVEGGPCGRTHHCTQYGNCLMIFSGGLQGDQSVDDNNVYLFSVAEQKWEKRVPKGDIPSSRQGHVVVSENESAFLLYGGLANGGVLDDLYRYSVGENRFERLSVRNPPPARAAHSALVENQKLYVFGGMDMEGAREDIHVIDLQTLQSTALTVTNSGPPARLDFGMCIVKMKTADEEDEETTLLVIQGGMNTIGDIYDDCWAIRI